MFVSDRGGASGEMDLSGPDRGPEVPLRGRIHTLTHLLLSKDPAGRDVRETRLK